MGSSLAAPRLDLVPLDAAAVDPLLAGRRAEAAAALGAALPDGWPDEHDARFLARRTEQARRDPALAEWLPRGLVIRENAQQQARLAGHAGFHGPPGVNGPGREDALEVGYTVFAPYRGRGYAGEAVAALVEWARESHGIVTFIASIRPDNAPSLAVARRLGFAQIGEQDDDVDGLELVFALELGDR